MTQRNQETLAKNEANDSSCQKNRGRRILKRKSTERKETTHQKN